MRQLHSLPTASCTLVVKAMCLNDSSASSSALEEPHFRWCYLKIDQKQIAWVPDAQKPCLRPDSPMFSQCLLVILNADACKQRNTAFNETLYI